MSKQRKPQLLIDGEGMRGCIVGHPIRELATGNQTDSRYTMVVQNLPPEYQLVEANPSSEHGIYVRDGEVRIRVGDHSISLKEGEFANVGTGTPFAILNPGKEFSRILHVVSPAPTGPFPMAVPMDSRPPMATPDNPVLVRRSGEGRHIAAVGDLYRFLATADETNGHYSLWEATVFPGGGPPPHIHLREEEGFFVLQGQVTFWIDGQRHQTFDGSFANMPMGVEHAFKNETDAPARMLILVAPGGLEKMFERTGEVLADPAAPIGPPSLQEIETLLKIAPEYGIEIRVPTEH